MWLKASLRHHQQEQATEECADGIGARKKLMIVQRVVLGAVWRIVNNEDVHFDGSGQFHQFLLEDMVQARVGSSVT